MRPVSAAVSSAVVCLLALPAAAQPEPSTPRSPRNASYSIEARYDPETKTIAGRQVLSWRNLQERETDELWFHLYWNGFRNNRSTWLLEDRIRGRSSLRGKPRAGDWGSLEVHAATLLGIGPGEAAEPAGTPILEGARGIEGAVGVEGPVDLLPTRRFESPDDGNPEDRTVMVLRLPRPVPPGATVEVEISFRAKVPRTIARTGFRGDFVFAAHWFPKLAVFEEDGWSCHQFHAGTEFYSDYGVYDVRLTLPERFVVGATGREVETVEHADGTVTRRFLQEDVHGFAWTASPDYRERRERFEEPGLPPVEMRLLYQPEHEAQAGRHLEATAAALKYYGLWYGPYPYGHVTVVDPAYGSGAGGMEYPTLFTSGTQLFNPAGGGSPEGVTIHEAGHQFWYGMVGNDEFEHAFLDEGLNTFSTARVYDEAFGERAYVKRYLSLPGLGRGFLPVLFEDLRHSRAVFGNRLERYRRTQVQGSLATPTFKLHPRDASRLSYDKTALWLATLERHLGWETLREILSTYFGRWSFRHPRPEDLFAVAEEVSGQDLDWFFDQVYGGSQSFDYAVKQAASKPFRRAGLFGEEGSLAVESRSEDDAAETEAETLYRSEVVVTREADGVFPVEVLLVFEDGSEARETWDGRERFTILTREGPSRLAWAAVDPERKLLLDVDYTNNSRQVEAEAAFPAYKWGSRWLVWLQDALGAFTFFI